MGKILQKELGFYIVVFQSQFNGLVKCWIDGSEDWTYYSVEEFMNFASKEGSTYQLRQTLKNCLSESSFFIWIVEEDVVKRLSPHTEPSDIRRVLNIDEMFKKDNQKENAKFFFDGRKKIKINGNNLI